jgi:heme-degrading monooxygenase HmoA
MRDMSVVKINVVTMPEDKWARFEERFKGRAGAVETTPGFEWFELLRPVEGTESYLVYTRWESDEAYQAWQNSQDFDRAHDGGGDTLAPAAERSQQHLWSYEVVESAAPKGS